MNWYYQKVNYLEIGKPMAEVKGIYLRKLPIAIADEAHRKLLSENVKILLKLCQQKYDEKLKFIHYISETYEPKRITEKLDDFDKLSYKDFCKELKNQKVILSSSEKMELLDVFEKVKQKVEENTKKINDVKYKVEKIVFDIYEIDEDTSKLILSEMQIIL